MVKLKVENLQPRWRGFVIRALSHAGYKQRSAIEGELNRREQEFVFSVGRACVYALYSTPLPLSMSARGKAMFLSRHYERSEAIRTIK
jgi:hypothetical protein